MFETLNVYIRGSKGKTKVYEMLVPEEFVRTIARCKSSRIEATATPEKHSLILGENAVIQFQAQNRVGKGSFVVCIVERKELLCLGECYPE